MQALIDNLIERGLDPKVCRLFIIDGARALSKVIRRTFGAHTPIQRCQMGSLKKLPPHRLYAAIGPGTALTPKPVPRRDLRNASGLQGTIQRRRSARRAAASRLRLMAAAVR